MKKIYFGDAAWKKELTQCYSFRFTETPDFTQNADHISTGVNKDHREGFDNISLLSPQPYTAGVKASLRCAFEGMGCPEIIIVEKPEKCEDGAVRYGACFEVVLYKNGVNVWRHYIKFRRPPSIRVRASSPARNRHVVSNNCFLFRKFPRTFFALHQHNIEILLGLHPAGCRK